MPSTSVTFYVNQKKVIDLFNSILLRLHNGDMEEEYDLIANALDFLVDSETQNHYSAGQQYEDEREEEYHERRGY